MAKNQIRTTKAKSSKSKVEWKFPLTKKNFVVFGIGVAIIAVGYLLMLTGLGDEYAVTTGGKWNNPLAVNVAPVLLVIGYCVVIPYSIYTYFGATTEETTATEE